MDSKFSDKVDDLQKTEEKLKKFGSILEKIEGADSNVKALWLEIYENANADRERASMLYTDIFMDVRGTPEKHGIYGVQLTKYLERMCKSNDQLIRLAEMIERAERQSVAVNADDIFSQISG
tara:strand:- start:1389 stop:1754 length:366 start_codon:yes stop_codon:yes gene_type:complete